MVASLPSCLTYVPHDMKSSFVVILGFLAHVLRVEAVDYSSQIKPLLKQKCYACHGGLKQKAGLRLDTVQLLSLIHI